MLAGDKYLANRGDVDCSSSVMLPLWTVVDHGMAAWSRNDRLLLRAPEPPKNMCSSTVGIGSQPVLYWTRTWCGIKSTRRSSVVTQRAGCLSELDDHSGRSGAGGLEDDVRDFEDVV